jgi:hypothetical protein
MEVDTKYESNKLLLSSPVLDFTEWEKYFKVISLGTVHIGKKTRLLLLSLVSHNKLLKNIDNKFVSLIVFEQLFHTIDYPIS